MSQPEQNAVLHPDPATSGNGYAESVKDGEGYKKDGEDYKQLQTLIHLEIEKIELILSSFYKKHFERYFPDGEARSLFKWDISRNDGTSQLQVFFKRLPEPPHAPHGKAREQADVHAPVARVEMARVAPSTDIETYDQVGTPPSGPVPQRP